MTTPNQQVPDGSITQYGRWSEVQDKAQEDWEAEQNFTWNQSFSKLFSIGDLLERIPIIGGFLSDFFEIVTGIPDSNPNDAGSLIRGFMDSVFAGLSKTPNPAPSDSFLTGVWNRLWGVQDDIEDLQDKTQALEGVIGYRATYMPQGSGTTPIGSWKWLGFTATVGPSVGTSVTPEGMIVLHSKGLWRADAQVYFSWEAVLGVVEVEIVVFDEFGDEYAQRSFKTKTSLGPDSEETVGVNFTFVVPRSGFGVRVRAYSQAGGREIRTGLRYTSFTVNKWSTETE